MTWSLTGDYISAKEICLATNACFAQIRVVFISAGMRISQKGLRAIEGRGSRRVSFIIPCRYRCTGTSFPFIVPSAPLPVLIPSATRISIHPHLVISGPNFFCCRILSGRTWRTWERDERTNPRHSPDPSVDSLFLRPLHLRVVLGSGGLRMWRWRLRRGSLF